MEPDNSNTNIGNTPPPATGPGTLYSGNTIYASVFGSVKDDAGQAVINATVMLNGAQTTTDNNGTFLFENTPVDAERAYIVVEKNGFFKGSRAFVPNATEPAIVSIQMLPRVVTGTVDNALGGTVNVTGGPQLIFDANDIALDNGGAYTGTVQVFASFMDPSDDALLEIMPGDLRALNTNGDAVTLGTYGMINVELEGTNGENLNVAPGAEVEIRMPIETSIQGNAPNTIPLWHFDDIQGNWVEDGSATKVGTDYVGTVDHFTIWNCDVPYNGKSFSVHIVDQNGVPVPSTPIAFRNSSGVIVGTGTSNVNGLVQGWCQSDAVLDLIIKDACNVDVSIQQVNSNGITQDFGTVALPQLNVNVGTITGTLVDCNNQPVANGFVFLQNGSNVSTTLTDQNGNFSTAVYYCQNNMIDVSGYNMTTTFTTAWTSVASAPVMNAGTIMACPPPTDFVYMNIDGDNYYWDESMGTNSIFASEPSGSSYPGDTNVIYVTNQMYFVVPDVQVGSYMNCNYPINGGQSPAFRVFSAGFDAPTNSIAIDITNWDGLGGIGEGSFSGSFNDTQGNPHVLTNGLFRISIQ